MDIATGSDGRNLVLYQYTPSKSAAYAFIILFGIGTVGHLFYMFRLRAWYFIPFLIGAISETFGYYGRAWSHDEPQNFKAYVMQVLLLLGAPPILAATIYMSLGRIIMSLGAEQHAMISPRWLTKIYVLIDVLCFCSQMAGVGLQVTGDVKLMETGSHIITAGLVFQLVALAFFVFIGWKVHRTIDKDPTSLANDPSLKWKKYMWALYAVSIAVLVRNLVRIVEFVQGGTGFVASHEEFIYVFDAFPLCFVVFLFLIIHPGKLIKVARYRSDRMLPMAELNDNSGGFVSRKTSQEEAHYPHSVV